MNLDIEMAIYALHDPINHEVRYVGKSVRKASIRMQRHLVENTHKSHKENWVNKLMKMNLSPYMSILFRCSSREELVEMEKLFIKYYRASGARLTNGTNGGDGLKLPQLSEDHRNKISSSLKGKAKSTNHRHNLSKSKMGHRPTEETREKLRNRRQKRQPLTESHRIKISRGRGSRPFFDQNGNLYQLQIDAARSLGLNNKAHINQVLNGKRKQTGGYTFSFIETTVREFPQ